MNRWHGVNLTLALLVVSLLTLHLWPREATQRPLTDLDPSTVTLIRVERGKRLHLALRRKDKGWEMTHPRAAPAEERRVQQLLAITRAPVQQEFPAGDAPGRYGLETPVAVLQFDRLRLQFGDRDPSQNSRYVLADGRIRVIDDVYFNLLSLPPGHFAGN